MNIIQRLTPFRSTKSKVAETPNVDPREDDRKEMTIYFEAGHDGHNLVCEDCGERVQITGGGLRDFGPVGCDCSEMEYTFEVVDDTE